MCACTTSSPFCSVVAPAIFVSRAREVLSDFAMDCDETGHLRLHRLPHRQHVGGDGRPAAV